MKRITSELLRSKRACRGQIDLFIALGGDHLELTEELCLKHAAKFDWNWASWKLLTPNARAEYNHVTRAARLDYHRIEQSAWAEHIRILQSAAASAEYQRVEQSAVTEYARVARLARAEFWRACASAFFRAWTLPANQDSEIAARSVSPPLIRLAGAWLLGIAIGVMVVTFLRLFGVMS